jgi:hypothetical protein
MVGRIESLFPGLQGSAFLVTSPATRDYNCVAWAANDSARWWWPDLDNDAAHWPTGVPVEETVEAFVQAFATLGFSRFESETPEPGFEKVALFAQGGTPTHVARQLPSGRWTSKLGQREDIEHDLHAISGDIYGSVVLILRRSTGPHLDGSRILN